MRNLIQPLALCYRLSMLLILLTCLQFTVKSQSTETMRANLNQVASNGATTLLDGNYTQYNNIYSDAVDWDDAWKMTNFGANLGILRDNVVLVIERRKIIPDTDTTYFKMWNLSQGDYQLEIITVNLNHTRLAGYIVDNYLGTKTPINLNGTTAVNFSITGDQNSAKSERFKLIYYTTPVPPKMIRYLMVDGVLKGNAIQVDWGIQDEITMEQYVVEHSTDGITYSSEQTVQALNTGDNHYSITDEHPVTGDNYYRVKGINRGGVVQYSEAVKVQVAPVMFTDINVYPNPVINKTVSIQIQKLPAGKYSIAIINAMGVKQQLKTIEVKKDMLFSDQLVLPAQLQSGIYRLTFTGPDNTVKTKTITVL